jgi:RHS repeat-associated protein
MARGTDYVVREDGQQPLRYAAREWDATAGLYQVRARWYDPQTGRFVSEDPIGLAGGVNTYAYALNSPVNYTDPSGRRSTATSRELSASGRSAGNGTSGGCRACVLRPCQGFVSPGVIRIEGTAPVSRAFFATRGIDDHDRQWSTTGTQMAHSIPGCGPFLKRSIGYVAKP